MPISLGIFAKEFEHRHDFDCEDQETLRSKHPNAYFSNIPDAWVIIIDEMMEAINVIDPGSSWCISQHYGFLSVLPIPNEFISPIIKMAEKRLYKIDIDLHFLLDCKVVV